LTSDLSAARNQLEDEDDKGDHQKQWTSPPNVMFVMSPKIHRISKRTIKPHNISHLLKGWPATLACRLIVYAARMSLQQREGRSGLVILLIGARGQSGSLASQ